MVTKEAEGRKLSKVVLESLSEEKDGQHESRTTYINNMANEILQIAKTLLNYLNVSLLIVDINIDMALHTISFISSFTIRILFVAFNLFLFELSTSFRNLFIRSTLCVGSWVQIFMSLSSSLFNNLYS